MCIVCLKFSLRIICIIVKYYQSIKATFRKKLHTIYPKYNTVRRDCSNYVNNIFLKGLFFFIHHNIKPLIFLFNKLTKMYRKILFPFYRVCTNVRHRQKIYMIFYQINLNVTILQRVRKLHIMLYMRRV